MIDDLLKQLRPVSSPWRACSPGFRSEPLSARLSRELPRPYFDLVDRLGPGEGFIGTRYLRLYPLDQIVAANEAYGVAESLPDHQIFGSDAVGNALLFDLRATPVHVVEAPFIPLDTEYIDAVHLDFGRFIAAFAAVPPDYQGPVPITPNPKTLGLEVHEKRPIVLGGDPRGTDNKVLVAPPDHAKACVFFNRVFREVRAQSR